MVTYGNRQEMEDRVIDLYYNQKKTYREIEKIVRKSPRDIRSILNKVEPPEHSMSVSSRAYNLFSEGKSPKEVAIALNLRQPEVTQYYIEYWRLKQLYNLVQIYEEIKDDIWPFVSLFKLTKAEGMDAKQALKLLRVANNNLPSVEQKYENLQAEVHNLELDKKNAELTLQKLNEDIPYLHKTADSLRKTCEELGSEKNVRYLQKLRLEVVIKQLRKNSQEYAKIEGIVKQELNNTLGNDKQILKLAFESITKSLLEDPFRFHSFFDYAMSVASVQSLSYTGQDNRSDSPIPGMHRERYLSANYEQDRKQVEDFKKIFLDESERLYNKKIEEVTSKTISEAACDDDSAIILSSQDEKEITKSLTISTHTDIFTKESIIDESEIDNEEQGK